MSRYYSKSITKAVKNGEQFCAALLIAALLFSALPLTALAEENASSTENTTTEPAPLEETENTDNTGTSTQETNTGEEETATSTEENNATTTPESTESDETGSSTATSTEEISENDGPDGESGSTTPDGTDGSDSATSSPDGTDTATSTATSTDPCGESDPCTGGDGSGENGGSGGSEGSDGGDGNNGVENTATTTIEGHESEPIPVVTEGLIGDTDAPEGLDETGKLREHARNNLTIKTGVATAQGGVFTDANSNNLRSVADASTRQDLDYYTFTAAGTNDASVTNDVASIAITGENRATAGGEAEVITGNAIAVFNVANVINSNIINSDGYLYLANEILEENTSLNLQDFFFPGGDSALAEAANCNLNSCISEDIEYNFSQQNNATITNDVYLEANTGDNYVAGDRGDITTGNAYGAANVVNVVNTNIIDSNYRLLTFNAVGNLDGDLILPTEELFDAFFGLPNGLNQLEQGEEASINVDNQNNALVNNNLSTYAESGQNEATAIDSSITTGDSEAESNVVDRVNKNYYGGDSMYLWIRIHGEWSGDVIGLPDGLTWQWTSDGVIIYNEDAEIEPSAFLGHDVDSYTANITNQNQVSIDNSNINIDAISGFNEVNGGLVGNIRTGNTYASANIMNIANTNVIGTNWTMAIVNIMGDFDGNVTFSQNDLSLTGDMTSTANPILPGSPFNLTYTVANSTDNVATNVIVTVALENAHKSGGTQKVQTFELGNMAPGASQNVSFAAVVDSDLGYGTSTVLAVATVESDEGDSNQTDNVVILTEDVFVTDPNNVATTTGTTTDPGSNATTTSTSTNPTTDDNESVNETPTNNNPPSRGGGGGRDDPPSTTETKNIDREKGVDDPNRAPILVVKKVSNVDERDVVKAGQGVGYTITVTNNGGTAYDAVVYDTLRNPIGSILDEQSWKLGTILAREVITLEYTTTYDFKTPSGTYTNTARVEAYRHVDSKKDGDKALKLAEAVHEIEINGVDLAVGNVMPLAYYPGANGTVNALVTWETNKPATGQVIYSPRTFGSVYNPLALNFGYQYQSFKFQTPKTKHYMIIRNLKPGVEYAYKIRTTNEKSVGLGGDYYFTVPVAVNTLTLAFPIGGTSRVAGAAATVPTPAPTPAPYVPPTPVVKTPTPAPTPDPEPEPETKPASSGVSGFVSKVFGFFR